METFGRVVAYSDKDSNYLHLDLFIYMRMINLLKFADVFWDTNMIQISLDLLAESLKCVYF